MHQQRIIISSSIKNSHPSPKKTWTSRNTFARLLLYVKRSSPKAKKNNCFHQIQGILYFWNTHYLPGRYWSPRRFSQTTHHIHTKYVYPAWRSFISLQHMIEAKKYTSSHQSQSMSCNHNWNNLNVSWDNMLRHSDNWISCTRPNKSWPLNCFIISS